MPVFSKLPTTHAQQLALLQSRGLAVPDEPFALHCLKHHNYYRLSAYRFTITETGNPDKFLPGMTFDHLWGLYCFDRNLRLLVTEAVKRLEISTRSHWGYSLAHSRGAQAYENPANFTDKYRHAKHLSTLDDELGRSEEAFIDHHRTQYQMNRPPVWAVSEIMSFGLLSRFCTNLPVSGRAEIAKPFCLPERTFMSLLRQSAYVRNMCAHHARLWNRKLTLTIELPARHPAEVVASLNPAEGRRLYNTLVMLAHVADVVDGNNPHRWAHRLRALIHSQAVPVVGHMGFPADWETRPMWMPDSSKPTKPSTVPSQHVTAPTPLPATATAPNTSSNSMNP